jgi:hypothetical protein
MLFNIFSGRLCEMIEVPRCSGVPSLDDLLYPPSGQDCRSCWHSRCRRSLLAACADGGGMPNMPRWGGFGGGDQRASTRRLNPPSRRFRPRHRTCCWPARRQPQAGSVARQAPSRRRDRRWIRQDTFQRRSDVDHRPDRLPGRPWWQHPSGREGRARTAAEARARPRIQDCL